MTSLTLEQQFAIKSSESQVSQMSREQAQEMLLSVYETLLVERSGYNDLLKKQWGIGEGSTSLPDHLG